MSAKKAPAKKPDKNEKVLVRLDTGKVEKTETMTGEELQRNFFD